MTKREPNARGEGDQLRRELVDAASRLLLSPQSIALPSLRAVARACSVSPAAVYLHFASQQALISAVIDAQLDQLSEHIRARMAGLEAPSERLDALAAGYVEWGLAHAGGYQLLFESADQLEIPEHSDDDDRWDLIHNAAALVVAGGGIGPDEASVVAFRLWAALHGIVSLRLHKSDVPWPTTVEHETRLVVARLSRGD
jgi:AcrR family transcriptional regulator